MSKGNERRNEKSLKEIGYNFKILKFANPDEHGNEHCAKALTRLGRWSCDFDGTNGVVAVNGHHLQLIYFSFQFYQLSYSNYIIFIKSYKNL